MTVASGSRRNGRLVLVGFAVAAVAAMGVPRVMAWWSARDLCPTEVTGHGRTPKGIDWTINKASCGPEVGTVWQVRLIAPGSVSQPVFTARGWPMPVAVEQDGEEAVAITVDRAPEGTTDKRITVHIDYKARSNDAPTYKDGVQQRGS